MGGNVPLCAKCYLTSKYGTFRSRAGVFVTVDVDKSEMDKVKDLELFSWILFG